MVTEKPKKKEQKKGDKDKMQVELLRDIVSKVAGEAAENIVVLLFKKKNVNEFLIAKRLELTINQTRNILYKLGDEGLVSFIRKKDSRKGGWYTYFWTLNVLKSLELLRNRIKEKLDSFEEEIGKRKKERFYYSPAAEIEYTEEEALEHDFICPETGDVMQLRDNTELLAGLKTEGDELRGFLDKTQAEMDVVEKKEMQAKEKKLKAEAKKKEEERVKRRKKLARLRKIEKAKLEKGNKKLKKNAKKKVKKKKKGKKKKKSKKKVKKKKPNKPKKKIKMKSKKVKSKKMKKKVVKRAKKKSSSKKKKKR